MMGDNTIIQGNFCIVCGWEWEVSGGGWCSGCEYGDCTPYTSYLFYIVNPCMHTHSYIRKYVWPAAVICACDSYYLVVVQGVKKCGGDCLKKGKKTLMGRGKFCRICRWQWEVSGGEWCSGCEKVVCMYTYKLHNIYTGASTHTCIYCLARWYRDRESAGDTVFWRSARLPPLVKKPSTATSVDGNG